MSDPDLDRIGAQLAFLMAIRGADPGSSAAGCRHAGVVAVRSIVDGELLAALCADCDLQLPAWWAA